MRLYAATVFLSAFLLFQIQPIVGKTILPRFGGSAAVWTTCLLFFQLALLAGYLYAHWSVRAFRPGTQRALHVLLAGASIAVLWFGRDAAVSGASNPDKPVLSILAVLALSIGLPYFLLSTTSPLMQAWYAQTHGVAFPYRLYALSNVASLAGLLAYPIVFEPLLATRTQWQIWSWLYCGFIVLCAASAWFTGEARRVVEPADDASPAPAGQVKILWVALPACASALLLAVTNHLSQDVAPVPFLWVLPLGAYLASFIVCFDRDDWYHPRVYRWLAAASLAAMGVLIGNLELGLNLKIAVPVFIVGLFLCCIFCHGELARLKPHAKHLTSFYLMMSAGGALGGLFVTVIAPTIYRGYFELQVSIAACALAILYCFRGAGSRGPLALSFAMLAVFAVFGTTMQRLSPNTRVMERNFYGAVRVKDFTDRGRPMRQILHGRITHGAQFLSPALERNATMYFGARSGAGMLLSRAGGGGRKVGIIGLGCGTLACYARHGDRFRFYEINPVVERLARENFKFLSNCEGEAAVVIGDARLSLEREAPQAFDVLIVDAFSGDSIPVHLLTREAFQLYFRHLAPHGVLALHITNTYLDLRPVVASIAASLGKPARVISNRGDGLAGTAQADWVLVPEDSGFFEDAAWQQTGIRPAIRPGFRVWTDDYSNLISVLK